QHIHSATGKKIQTEIYTYNYDHAGRLKLTTHDLDGTKKILADNYYDELGRLRAISPLKLEFTYNIRSWTNSINYPQFREELSYSYGGNIDRMQWIGENTPGAKTYFFAYDNLSRLIRADYSQGFHTSYDWADFSTGYKYDKQGNITSLYRNGKTDRDHGTIDELYLDYQGNQLVNVYDEGKEVLTNAYDFKDYADEKIEYEYNANGAMVSDLNKGISKITYNHQNLPVTLSLNNPLVDATNEYTYTATGAKLKVVHRWTPVTQGMPMKGLSSLKSPTPETQTTDYAGNKIYENGELSKILTGNGYYEDGKYYFYVTNHLGSNVAVVDEFGQVIQTTDYYPFGMTAGGEKQDRQPYKYGNKELDEMNGLNLYDFLARGYDPAIGRFMAIDPLAEKYPWMSPYAYCKNNPVNRIDPTGMVDYLASTMTPELWQNFNPEEDTMTLNEVAITPKGGGAMTVEWEDWQTDMYQRTLKDDPQNLQLLLGYKNLFAMEKQANQQWLESRDASIGVFGDVLSKESALFGVTSTIVYNPTMNTWMGGNFKFYSMNFNGNGYTGGRNAFAGNLGSGFKWLGRATGALSIGISANQFRNATTIEGKSEYATDVFMGGIGFVPGVGTAVSLFWSFGGKQLHWNHVNEVVVPAIQMEMPPYSYLPYK
ncbi:MAG: RHS repeat-associated core domain-containing protein, partial [Candidatus Symbiothrix sp.]|nr:RHS repeat-associated core domain-containing protein [Candidatus Symbiothrix sp.]